MLYYVLCFTTSLSILYPPLYLNVLCLLHAWTLPGNYEFEKAKETDGTANNRSIYFSDNDMNDVWVRKDGCSKACENEFYYL
jgi:hypothetical protein